MREMILKKALPLLLSAVLLVGAVPLEAHGEEAAGLSWEQRQTVTGREMEDWFFPLPEECFGSIQDFAGCRGAAENALYGSFNDGCQENHGELAAGSPALIVSVSGSQPVFAPASGTLYRSSQPDEHWGDAAVIEVPVDGSFSYYLLLGSVSADVPSGSYVSAGSTIGYTSGSFHFGALMDYSNMGGQIAEDVSGELSFAQSMGWLLGGTGSGLICVNPAADTPAQNPSAGVYDHSGPIRYQFVSAQQPETPTEAPVEIPTEAPIEVPTEAPIEVPTEAPHTEHIWDNGTVTVPATHTQSGFIHYSCTICGEGYDETIPADSTAHVFDQAVAAEQYLAANANCGSPALYYYSCLCGEKGTETFAVGQASGEHQWNGGEVTVPASHTAPGSIHYTCTICGATYDEPIPADSTAHVFDQTVAAEQYLASPANCASPALYYYSCLCGEKGTETFAVGQASGEHQWNEGEVTVPASHTAPGNRHYSCTVCGASYDEPIPASGDHVFDQEIVNDSYLASAATCDAPARYYYSCVCGEKGTETFAYGEAAAHSFSDQWSHDETNHWRAATCQHTGETTDFGPHKWDDGVITKDAGHNVSGQKRYTCTVCGYQIDEAIPGQPHEYNQEVVSDAYLASPATCTSPAQYYYSCVCGEKGTETFSYGEAKGHTFSDKWSSDENSHWQAATCEHTDQRIKVAEHIWSPGEITTQPTATTKGVKTYTCTVCGRTKTEEVEPSTHQHTFSTNWAGNSTYHWHEATCEHKNVVSGLGEHTWDQGTVTAWPTHNAAGSKVYTCTVCYMQKTETLNQTHTYDQQIASDANLASRATCSSPATYYYSCSCGARDTTRTFPYGSALGHTASSAWGKDANYHWTVCSRCGAKGELIAHTFDSNGICTVCGGSKQDAHVHSSHLTRVAAKAATCTQSGNTAYYVCDCGMWFTDVTCTQAITDQQSVVLPAQGHVDQDNNGRCDVCKERLDSTTEYQMTEGGESTWLNTSGQGLVFRSNADYSKFDHVEVDGATVANTNYSVSQGSTIVELNASYLKRLSLGRHTISIVAKDGKATSGFTIKQGATTGSSGSSNGIWGIILFLTVVVAMAIPITYGMYYYRKKTGDRY